jgi:hypothetical protein
MGCCRPRGWAALTTETRGPGNPNSRVDRGLDYNKLGGWKWSDSKERVFKR